MELWSNGLGVVCGGPQLSANAVIESTLDLIFWCNCEVVVLFQLAEVCCGDVLCNLTLLLDVAALSHQQIAIIAVLGAAKVMINGLEGPFLIIGTLFKGGVLVTCGWVASGLCSANNNIHGLLFTICRIGQ